MGDFLIVWYEIKSADRIVHKKETVTLTSIKHAKAYATNNGQNRQDDVDIHLLDNGSPIRCVAIKRLQSWLNVDSCGNFANHKGLRGFPR